MTTFWKCTGYEDGDEYPFSMECRIEGECGVHLLNLAITEDEIRGVHYTKEGARCGTCLRLRKLCMHHDILDDEDPALIARAIAAFRRQTGGGAAAPPHPTPRASPPAPASSPSSSPSRGRDVSTGGAKKRKADDGGAAVNTLDAYIKEINVYAKRLEEGLRVSSTRSDFYEEKYREAHRNYTKTKAWLETAIREYRKGLADANQAREQLEAIMRENDRLRAIVADFRGQPAIGLDFSSLDNAMDTLRNTLESGLLEYIMTKPPMQSSTEEDVNIPDAETRAYTFSSLAQNQDITDQDLLNMLHGMSL